MTHTQNQPIVVTYVAPSDRAGYHMPIAMHIERSNGASADVRFATLANARKMAARNLSNGSYKSCSIDGVAVKLTGVPTAKPKTPRKPRTPKPTEPTATEPTATA